MSPILIHLLEAGKIFLSILYWIIIIDILLSWAVLLGVRIRIGFIHQITTPLYGFVRKYLPVRMGMLDFSPIILVLGFEFARYFLSQIQLFLLHNPF